MDGFKGEDVVGVAFVGVSAMSSADGAFDGVFAAEGVGVDGGGFAEGAPRLSLISPYSFHSSTCSRS